ncbi:MAG: hypothetical protein ACTSXY_15130 [Promethearchaeota archaeon]
MSLKYKVHSQDYRENQYELFYDLIDENGNVVIGNRIISIGKEKSDDKKIDKIMKDVILEFENAPIEDPIEKVYIEFEIEELLKEKGFLKSDEKLKDLKTLKELKELKEEKINGHI